MSVLFDNSSTATQGTGTLSWTHIPITAAPSAILLGVIANATGSDDVTGAEYGGVGMTEITGSPFAFSTNCVIHIFELTSSVPTGNQTVTVSVSGAGAVRDACCLSYTADNPVTVNVVDSFNASGTGNLTDTLNLGGVASTVVEFGWSSGNNTLRTTPLTDWTARDEGDFGTEIHFTYTYDIENGTTNVVYGVAHDQNESAFVVAVALTDAGGGPANQIHNLPVKAYTYTTIAPTHEVVEDSFIAHGVEFDGTDDYLARGGVLTNAVGTKVLSGSIWFNTDQAAIAQMLRASAADSLRLRYQLNSDGSVNLFGRSIVASTVFSITTSAGYNDGAWHNLLYSVDVENASNRHLYIDDVSDLNVTTYTDFTIDLSGADEWNIAANSAGAEKYNGCLAEIWLDDNYIDFSVEANRRKFISASGQPVNLGADGSTPIGSAPLIYLGGNDQEAAGWETNKGSGGGFTENGALTDCATDPSINLAGNQVHDLATKLYTYTPIVPTFVQDHVHTLPVKSYTYTSIAPVHFISNVHTLPIKEYTYASIAPVHVQDHVHLLPVLAYTYTPVAPEHSLVTPETVHTLPVKQYTYASIAPLHSVDQIHTLPIKAYTYSLINPVHIQDHIHFLPVKEYTYTLIAPVHAVNLVHVLPLKLYTYAPIAPTHAQDHIHALPVKSYSYTPVAPTHFVAQIHILPIKAYAYTTIPPVHIGDRITNFNIFDLDLTPPRELSPEVQRWLINNFAILRNVLEFGTDGTFTTSDGRTLVIRNGIVEQIYLP